MRRVPALVPFAYQGERGSADATLSATVGAKVLPLEGGFLARLDERDVIDIVRGVIQMELNFATDDDVDE